MEYTSKEQFWDPVRQEHFGENKSSVRYSRCDVCSKKQDHD